MKVPRLLSTDIKHLLARLWHKETLVFVFFLLLSATFWLLNKLSEQTEVRVSVPIKLVGVPPNIIVTEGLPEHIELVLSDRGTQLLYYRYTLRIDTLRVNFSQVQTPSGSVILTTDSLLTPLLSQLDHSTKWSVGQPRLTFSYNYGSKKRVPVRFVGLITADEDYYLTYQRFSPDSVTVYAPMSVLDTLTEVRTQPLRLSIDTDSAHHVATLHKLTGTRLDPEAVRLHLYADRLMDKQVEAQVQARGVPDGFILRTFPTRLTLSLQVGTQNYEQVNPKDIEVYVDYKDLRAGSTTLPLRIGNLPVGVHRAKVHPSSVEYLLERDQ